MKEADLTIINLLKQIQSGGGGGGTTPSGTGLVHVTSGTQDSAALTLGANLSISGGALNAAGGSGSPGGTNTQLQYNNSSAFGGTGITTDGKSLTFTSNGAITGQQNLTRFQTNDSFGDFGLGLQLFTPAGGNNNDAGRTVTDGKLTNGSAFVTSVTAFFNLGDRTRGITATGIPVPATISSIPSTAIAIGSNNVSLPTGTINVVATASWSSSATGSIQVLTSTGYQIVAYTGKTGTTFTGCTGGTGTMSTGNAVSSVTEAVMSSNATATNTGVSVTIAGRNDNVLSWGYNLLGWPFVSTNDASFSYNLENSFTTAGGVRQTEHYINVSGEDQTLIGRVLSITTANYDNVAHHAINTADIGLRSSSLEIGHPNNNNDWLTFNTASTSAGASKMSLGNNSSIDSNSTNADFITAGGNALLGYTSSGSKGRLFGDQTFGSIFSKQTFGNTVTLAFGDSGGGDNGIRWDTTSSSMQLGRFGVWNSPVVNWVASLGIGNHGSGSPAAAIDVETNMAKFLRIGDTSNGYAYDFSRNGGDGYMEILGTQTSSNGFRFKTDGSGGSNALVVQNSGGVGVGTNADPGANNFSVQGILKSYNTVATAGNGVAAIVASARVTAQSAANASIVTFTVGASDSSFEVSMNMNVTAATAISTSMNCTYTDESNTSRTMIFPTTSLSGSFLAGGLVTGTGAFETPVMHIRCKASTSITLLTATGTFSSATYTAEGNIKQTR